MSHKVMVENFVIDANEIRFAKFHSNLNEVIVWWKLDGSTSLLRFKTKESARRMLVEIGRNIHG